MPTAAVTAPGSNAERSRAYNRGLVLGHIRARPGVGRAAIARAAGLSVQAVSNIIAELCADGLVAVAGRRVQGRGLPPVHYRIDPAGGFALGVELRPRGLAAALVDLDGGLVWQGRSRLAAADPGAVAAALGPLAAAARAAAGPAKAARILGAGVVMPGPFGATGLSDPATELPGWAGIAPVAWFEYELGLPCLVENDANAAALAERLRGGARLLADFAFLYFGAGIGLGVVAGDRLLRGARGNAGEIGHVGIGGTRLEALASRVALEQRLAAAGMPCAGIDDLQAAVAAGAAPVADWLAVAAPALGEAIGIVENLFDPETVFVGGVLPDPLIDALIARVPLPAASLACRPGRSLPRLCRGASGRLTAVLGAAALVIEPIFTPRLDAA